MSHPQHAGEGEGLSFVESHTCITSNGCWEWIGSIDGHGYGKYNDKPAHKLVYEVLVGPIAQGLIAHHKCKNPSCVNPNHIELLTPKQHSDRHPSTIRKEYCIRGHLLEGDNLYIRPDNGYRLCKACRKARDDRWVRIRQQRRLAK